MTGSDVFVFECDLDKGRPADERATMNVCHDGEHVAFDFAYGGVTEGRTVYLTPDDAANLGALATTLTGGDVDDGPAPTSTAVKVVAGTMLFALVAGVVNPILAILL